MQPHITPIFGSWFLNMKNIKKDYYKTIITIMAVNQMKHETHTEYLRYILKKEFSSAYTFNMTILRSTRYRSINFETLNFKQNIKDK